jgi:hypothetical protein
MAESRPNPYQAIDAAIQQWQQGDVIFDPGFSMFHLASATEPVAVAAQQAAKELPVGEPSDLLSVASEVPGFVVLTQTCDIVRACQDRPYIELAPLREVSAEELGQVIRAERPALAYIPALADRRLVADLDRTMTIEKPMLASLARTRGVTTDPEMSTFQRALARKRQRFAFPTSFTVAIRDFQKRMINRAGKDNPEGRHVDAVREIRVAAAPAWNVAKIALTFWLIKERDPDNAQWNVWIPAWEKLIDQKDTYTLDTPLRVRFLEDMTAREYLTSQPLDLDHLSDG